MTDIGINFASEAHGPDEIVDYAVRAEEAGFDFAVVSDHFHPWISKQGESPFVWSTLGGIARETEDLGLGTSVTCPTIRIHPANVAHAAATAGEMLDGRFFLGVGTGENLNEHVLGDRWPAHHVRLEMLEEAVGVIRDLWGGEMTSHYGDHYTVENARIFTLPDEPPSIHVSALGPETAAAAGEFGDGLITTSPDEALVDRFQDRGDGPIYGGTKVSWAESDEAGREKAVEWWPNAFADVGGAELPLPKHFEEATQSVTGDDVEEAIVTGPDAEEYLDHVEEFEDAGFDRVYLHHVGQDQEAFIEFAEDELLPEVS
jgi:G6PDH family F420-dependent oxidoreductase